MQIFTVTTEEQYFRIYSRTLLTNQKVHTLKQQFKNELTAYYKELTKAKFESIELSYHHNEEKESKQSHKGRNGLI